MMLFHDFVARNTKKHGVQGEERAGGKIKNAPSPLLGIRLKSLE
jgi:hypothetical protein